MGRRYLWRSVPRRVRKNLAINAIASCSSQLATVYPDLNGRSLMSEVEDLIEDIVRRAIKFSPTQNAIYAERVMETAALSLIDEEPNPDRAALYRGIWKQLASDWYPSSGS